MIEELNNLNDSETAESSNANVCRGEMFGVPLGD